MKRIADAGSSPKTRAVTEVFDLFAKQARERIATPEPEKPEPVLKKLTDALLYVVRLPSSQVGQTSLEEAEKAWTDHITGAGSEPSGPPQGRNVMRAERVNQ